MPAVAVICSEWLHFPKHKTSTSKEKSTTPRVEFCIRRESTDTRVPLLSNIKWPLQSSEDAKSQCYYADLQVILNYVTSLVTIMQL